MAYRVGGGGDCYKIDVCCPYVAKIKEGLDINVGAIQQKLIALETE